MKLKKFLLPAGLTLVVALGAAQFFHPARNTGVTEGPNSLVAREKVPANVKAMLQRACYDCHSDNTHYPWYASVQPVAWWLADHVNEGKRELNLSDFARYDNKRAVRKLEDIADEVNGHSMPLKSYLLMHPEARLTEAERAALGKWALELSDEIATR